MSVVQRSEGSIIGVGRIRLHYRTWEVPNARAVVVIVHGLAEHGGRYEDVGTRLAAYAFSSFVLDLRGHGVSEGRRGHAASFNLFLQDIERFRREVLGLVTGNTPAFLLGHSMGGLIALRYQEEYADAFDGAIISSPWLATAMPAPRWKTTLASAFSRVLPTLPFSARLVPEDLSRDPAVVAAYREDPLVHDTITPRLFAEASHEMGLAFQRTDRLASPLLFLLAGNDKVVDVQRSVRFAKSISAPDVTIKVYPGLYHEVLNEPERNAVIGDVRDWIAARLP